VWTPFFEVAGFVDDQHRACVAEVFGEVVTQVVADLLGVPDCFAQQVLHPVGGVVAGVFGDGPAVLVRQV
jgi:hypothetical protein